MHTYMQHVTSQQAANHRGQVQLNESFYRYTLHQQSQDPSPFPWPTLEQFGAIVAWPGDEPDFQTWVGPAGEGPTGAPGDEDGAQEDDDMVDVLEYFM